jgi:hypothetical protein
LLVEPQRPFRSAVVVIVSASPDRYFFSPPAGRLPAPMAGPGAIPSAVAGKLEVNKQENGDGDG